MKPDRTTHSEWMDRFFESYYRHRPVNATFIGLHEFDGRLPDFTETGAGDALADVTDLLRGAEGSSEPLTSVERLDRKLSLGFLRTQDWEFRSRHFHRGNPSLYTGEAVFSVLGLLLTDFGPLSERMESATARMHQIPDFLAQGRENVRQAPEAWTQRAIRECSGAMVFFTDGAAEFAALNGGGDTTAFLRAAHLAAQAFSDHQAHLRAEVLQSDTGAYSAGGEAFNTYLRDGHFLAQSPPEMLRYAEDQILEAQASLSGHAVDFGASDPEEALSRLQDLHPEAGEYYTCYQSVWDEVRAISDEKGLLTWPDFPIRYVPRPTWVQAAAPHLYFLFYRSPATYHRPAVHDYLVAPLPERDVTAFLQANNTSVIKRNHVIHHGGLGHHVQNWHASRAESRVGQVAAVDCASRIAMFCGGTMAEGWACYATDLASEAGALTPLERYAEVQGRIRMAARAVVDIRLHHGEISLEEATTYYHECAGMNESAARGEAVKNSMFPGAAVMYLMGTDAIHELRRDMQRIEGPDFELQRFHDTLLSYGSIPVSLIAEDMKRSADDAG